MKMLNIDKTLLCDGDEVMFLEENLVSLVGLDGVLQGCEDAGLLAAPGEAAAVTEVSAALGGQLRLVTAGPPARRRVSR